MAKRVLIEYTEDVQSYSESRHEAVPIENGTQRYVDPASAESLVNVKKVAKFVTDDEPAVAVEEDGGAGDEDGGDPDGDAPDPDSGQQPQGGFGGFLSGGN